MTPEQELDGWKLAFAHAIMRSPEEAFTYDVGGKSIAVRAQEFFEKEITKRDIATIRTRHDLLEAWDLIAVMRTQATRKHNQDALDMAYGLIAWLMCKGESAETFEAFLEIGRKFMRENNGIVTRVIHGKAQPGVDYRKPKTTSAKAPNKGIKR